MEKILLRPTEVAEALGICRSKAYQLLATGALPGVVRLGRCVRISKEELHRWVAEQSSREEASGSGGRPRLTL